MSAASLGRCRSLSTSLRGGVLMTSRVPRQDVLLSAKCRYRSRRFLLGSEIAKVVLAATDTSLRNPLADPRVPVDPTVFRTSPLVDDRLILRVAYAGSRPKVCPAIVQSVPVSVIDLASVASDQPKKHAMHVNMLTALSANGETRGVSASVDMPVMSTDDAEVDQVIEGEMSTSVKGGDDQLTGQGINNRVVIRHGRPKHVRVTVVPPPPPVQFAPAACAGRPVAVLDRARSGRASPTRSRSSESERVPRTAPPRPVHLAPATGADRSVARLNRTRSLGHVRLQPVGPRPGSVPPDAGAPSCPILPFPLVTDGTKELKS